MKYIFFDIECANCFDGNGKICSFGYVITDTFFNVIDKEDIIINPKAPFMLRHKGKDCIKLAYSKNEFKAAPDFPEFYRKIKKLLHQKDALVFGYASENDQNFLRSECDRYILPCINFITYDVQKLLKMEMKFKNSISLSAAEAYFGVCSRQEIHKSDDDSLMTMEVLKNLCIKSKKSPIALINEYPECATELLDFSIILKKREGKYFRNIILGDHSNYAEYGSDNYICVLRFIHNVTKNTEKKNFLTNKIFFLYPKFIAYDFSSSIKLIQLITDSGGAVTDKVSDAEYLIYRADYNELGEKNDPPQFNKQYANISKIKPITFDELLNIARVDYYEFASSPCPDVSYLLDDKFETKHTSHRKSSKRNYFKKRKRNNKNK